MKHFIPIAQIKLMLIGRMSSLVAVLAPGGRIAGNNYTVKNPTRPDHKAGSFVIYINGAKTGGWVDFADGHKGDVIDLIAYCAYSELPPFSSGARITAVKWAEVWLGLNTSDPLKIEKMRREATARQKDLLAKAAAKQVQNKARSFEIFAGGLPLTGSLAQKYLEGDRGIDFTKLSNMERSIRFKPRLGYWLDRSQGAWPCMLAAFKDVSGIVTGLHGTFLDPEKACKVAHLQPSKLTFGGVKGSVIRVSRGISNLTPEEAVKEGVSGPLILVEGIEDAFTMALAAPDLRVWAAGSLGNLSNVPKHPCVSSYLLCLDNDTNERACLQSQKAIEHFGSHKLPVSVLRSSSGKDFNDLLRGKS